MASKQLVQSVRNIVRSQLNRQPANGNTMRATVNVNKLDRMALWRGGRSQSGFSPMYSVAAITSVPQPPRANPKR